MLTLKQIAQQLGITVARARLCAKSAGVKSSGSRGRANLYVASDVQKIEYNHTHFTPTRKRCAKSTASTQTESPRTTAEQGSETAIPAINPVAGDSQAILE